MGFFPFRAGYGLKYFMDFSASDILFLVVVLLLAITILNGGNWGGGRRARVPNECAM
jgi:hypothetical protein